jgi:hypothetical protein
VKTVNPPQVGSLISTQSSSDDSGSGDSGGSFWSGVANAFDTAVNAAFAISGASNLIQSANPFAGMSRSEISALQDQTAREYFPQWLYGIYWDIKFNSTNALGTKLGPDASVWERIGTMAKQPFLDVINLGRGLAGQENSFFLDTLSGNYGSAFRGWGVYLGSTGISAIKAAPFTWNIALDFLGLKDQAYGAAFYFPITALHGLDPNAFKRGDISGPGAALVGEIAVTAGLGAVLQAEAAAAPRGGTYLLRHPTTGRVMRTGRTADLHGRELDHLRDPLLRRYKFKAVHHTDVYAEQRGLEEILDQTYRPPLNQRRPIYINNPNLERYLLAAIRFLLRQ